MQTNKICSTWCESARDVLLTLLLTHAGPAQLCSALPETIFHVLLRFRPADACVFAARQHICNATEYKSGKHDFCIQTMQAEHKEVGLLQCNGEQNINFVPMFVYLMCYRNAYIDGSGGGAGYNGNAGSMTSNSSSSGSVV